MRFRALLLALRRASTRRGRLRVKLGGKPGGSVSTYDATLSWTLPAFAATTGYYVFLNGAQVGSPAGSPYVFQGLNAGTTYTLGVQAHNGSGGTSSIYSTQYTTPGGAANPLLSTLTDTFPGSALDAQWTSLLGANTVAGNEDTIALTTSYATVGSTGVYDCTNGSFWIECIPQAGVVLGEAEFGIYLSSVQGGLAGANGFGLGCIDGTLKLTVSVAGVHTDYGATTYSSTIHQWLRLRISGGTVYGDYSADGTNWTNYQSTSFSFAITGLYAGFYGGYDLAEAAASVSFADVNIIPSAAQPFSGFARPGGGLWTLQFEDLFPGSSVDANKWYVEDGWSINNVTTHAANVVVSGGQLQLYLPSSSSGAEINSEAAYVGTGKGCAFPVGAYVEFYAMFPGLVGSPFTPYNWSAVWTWADTPSAWPIEGEIDVMETQGHAGANHNSGTVANVDAWPNGLTVAGNWVNSFHRFAAYRGGGSSGNVYWYWDTTLVRTLALQNPSTGSGDNGQPQALRMTAGSGFTAQYNSVVSGIPALTVDYVRVWT